VSWVPGAAGSGFDADHLPYGVVQGAGCEPQPAVRVGDSVLPLREGADLLGEASSVVNSETLTPLLAAGRPAWQRLRARLQELLTDEVHRAAVEPLLRPVAAVEPLLPFEVADYVDFYSSEQHARNVGQIFRPDAEPLLPNWKHLPVGYHGRAGTVVVSGTEIPRPCGQRRAPQAASPVFGPSQRLDIEAEVGFVVGTPSEWGRPVASSAFDDHVFGVVLVNDWSARDIQAWEYVPLGPFLGKSFATSIAGWITPMEALAAARVATPLQDPPVLEYLAEGNPWGLDLRLEVAWNGEVVSRPPFASMYWSPSQQLAHLTVNGASLRTGDLFASGTVSGEAREERGSFLELSWNGAEPVKLEDGSTRTFLEDGDEVTITATAPSARGGTLTLAEVSGRITPARRG
jgi:fumarylacetoacetase